MGMGSGNSNNSAPSIMGSIGSSLPINSTTPAPQGGFNPKGGTVQGGPIQGGMPSTPAAPSTGMPTQQLGQLSNLFSQLPTSATPGASTPAPQGGMPSTPAAQGGFNPKGGTVQGGPIQGGFNPNGPVQGGPIQGGPVIGQQGGFNPKGGAGQGGKFNGMGRAPQPWDQSILGMQGMHPELQNHLQQNPQIAQMLQQYLVRGNR